MGVSVAGRRGEVYLIDLGNARGREIRKARPCVIVSPDDMNAGLGTYLVAPLTTGAHPYAFRIPCRFGGKNGQVIADQVRVVASERLIKRLGVLNGATISHTLATLRDIFAD